MKKYKTVFKNVMIFTLWMISISSIKLEAQNAANGTDLKSQITIEKEVLKSALNNQDLNVAVNSLYHLIAKDTLTKTWKDTLCKLYYMEGAFQQCAMVGVDILKTNPNNTYVMEMVALSEKNLKIYIESLSLFENLYSKSNNILYLYQIAEIQYSLLRFGECEQSILSMLKMPEAKKVKISLNAEDGRQDVPLDAAVLNMQGILYNQIGKKAESVKCFESALKQFPDFVLAKRNLEAQTKKESPSNKPNK